MKKTNVKANKKENLRKAMAAVAAAALCLNGASAFLSTTVAYAALPEEEIIFPLNIAIMKTENDLTLGLLGKLSCYGKTTVESGYKAGVKVELQQLDGSWGTIKTWETTGTPTTTVDESYYVTKGYSYRLKLTHKAYNSSGTLIEEITKYSDTVSY